MGDSTTVVLQCISVVDNFIDGYPFGVDVPCGGLCSGIVGRVVKVIPSLQGVDHNRFRLYKPPSSHSIPVSYSLDRFRLTKEHLTDPLLPPYTVKEKFQEKFQENGNDRHLSVDVIICVDSRGQAGTSSSALHPLSEQPRSNFLTYVTFTLRAQTELQLPPDDLLDMNGLIELPAEEVPDFIKRLEAELHLQRSTIGFHGAAAHMLDALKALLGESFGKYFTDSSNGPEMRRVSDLELVHYVVALADSHLSDKVTYTAKPEPHIYNLLGRFTKPPPSQPDAGLQCGTAWSFGLVVKVKEEEFQYRYIPRSDFFMGIKGFPHLVAEVVSDRSGGKDKNRMLLQASRLVRLGNALLTEKPPEFVAKAIYFDRDFQATEYTLYQRGPKPDSKVEYSKDVHDLSQRLGMFTLVFRLYNFRLSMVALHGKLSKDLADSLSSIRSGTHWLPAITSRRGLSSSIGSSLKRKRSTGPSSVQGKLQGLKM